MEAVVELDRSVAEAIGWFVSEQYPLDWMSAMRREWPIAEFTPSVDLNAAFLAAERVGLFDATRMSCCLYQTDCEVNPFVIARIDWVGDEEEVLYLKDVASAATPALAICAAILKLKEHKDGRESSV